MADLLDEMAKRGASLHALGTEDEELWKGLEALAEVKVLSIGLTRYNIGVTARCKVVENRAALGQGEYTEKARSSAAAFRANCLLALSTD